jgi:hypothetical protein
MRLRHVVVLCCVVLNVPLPIAAQSNEAPTAVLEIRSYNLKPGTRDAYHQMLVKEALPMLQRAKVDVVAYGPSLHDADSYYLMRAFPSAAARDKAEEAFYGSEEWKKGLRERVLAAIVNFTTVVIEIDQTTLNALRSTMKAGHD